MRRVRFVAFLALALALTIPMFFVTGIFATSHASPVPAGRLNRHAIVLFPTRSETAQLKRTHKSTRLFPAVSGSGNLAYGGGPVQHNPVSYLIFWGSSWTGSDSGTASIIQSWFNDFGGTSFENIDTQYYDNSGHINDTHSLNGVDFVSSAPPTDSTCTANSTVEDSSLQSEVSSAISAKGWPTDGSNAVYYVYLPSGDSLNDGGSNGCSAAGGGGYCAYHNWTGSVEYGAMPYPVSGCQVSTSPNGNVNGDSEVNLTSHEQAESITDPYPPGNGWIDSAGYEIGDKCAWDFSSGLTHMNNGGTFEVQTEYSNASSSCVNSYGTVPPTPTPTPGSGNNFSISANPTSLSITQGSSGTSTISTAVTSGSAGTVSLTASVSPSGPTASLSPTSVTAGGSSTLTVSVGSTVATGNYTVTVKGTEGTTSHSTSVTVSVTGSGGGTTTQLLANPGFENGQSPWQESSANGYQIVDPTNPHTGSYSAYLCGYDDCNDQIWQTVTLPSTTTKVVLSYWFYSDTYEASGSPCYDYFHARIRTSTGGTITTVQTKCNSNVTNGWVHYTFDITSALSGYHGKQIEVYFQGTTDVSLPTDFFVDDVALNVTH